MDSFQLHVLQHTPWTRDRCPLASVDPKGEPEVWEERGETEQLLSGGMGGDRGAPPRSGPALAVCSPLSLPRALVPLSYELCVLPGGGGAPVATGSEARVPLSHGSLCPSCVMLTHALPITRVSANDTSSESLSLTISADLGAPLPTPSLPWVNTPDGKGHPGLCLFSIRQ